jgi:hypothetical protein
MVGAVVLRGAEPSTTATLRRTGLQRVFRPEAAALLPGSSARAATVPQKGNATSVITAFRGDH